MLPAPANGAVAEQMSLKVALTPARPWKPPSSGPPLLPKTIVFVRASTSCGPPLIPATGPLVPETTLPATVESFSCSVAEAVGQTKPT